jgi:hypothetical protein
MSLDYYSDIFKDLLLRNVVIKTNNKVYRSGKINNFDIKQFYIKITIENNKKQIKQIELPYPFRVSQSNNITVLNYHLSAFCSQNTDAYSKLLSLNSKESSKFFNNIIEITIVE